MNGRELVEILDQVLLTNTSAETGGIIAGSPEQRVKRIGLTLDWTAATPAWIAQERLDTIWVHRRTGRETYPDGILVLSHHEAYDRRFGLAHNENLWSALSINGVPRILSTQPALAVADLNEPSTLIGLAGRLRERFGGLERSPLSDIEDVMAGSGYISRIALADGMRPELLRAAVSAGAGIYISGQWRPSADAAAEQLNLPVSTIGHERLERRGLTDLAHALKAATQSTLTVTILL